MKLEELNQQGTLKKYKFSNELVIALNILI